MFEILSDQSWIAPQIDFLIFLQNLRIEYGHIFNSFFLNITALGEFFLPTVICAVIYWSIDSKGGTYMFAVSGFNVIVAHLFKLLACVYRPWVLSDKVKPLEAALNHARSYSFPSGHSATSSSVLGALAYFLRNKTWICLTLIVLIMLIGFSRLWLGVHTPQDVIGGFIIGITLVFTLYSIINWAEKDKNRYISLLIITNILALLIMIYLSYIHKFPWDYVDGKLLVNPMGALYTTITCYGYTLGILNGLFICRRFFPFDASLGNISTRILRCLIGLLCFIYILKYPFESVWEGSYRLRFVLFITFLIGLFPTAIYPYIFTKVENFIKEEKQDLKKNFVLSIMKLRNK